MQRRSRLVPIATLALGFGLFLTACGLIPPIDVQDPFGLDGQQITVALGPVPAALAPLAVDGTASETFTFDDADLGDLPLDPSQITNEIGFAAITLDREDGPSVITLTDITVTLRVWQNGATYDTAPADQRAQASFVASSGSVTLNSTGNGVGVTNYAVDGSDVVGVLSMTGSDVGHLLKILAELPSTNSGSLTVTLQADPDELAGGTLTIELDAATGQITF